jgi:hypothetical protein
MKKCRRCLVEKEAHLFPRNKKLKDGLHTYCKECTRLYYKKNNIKFEIPDFKTCTKCLIEKSQHDFYKQNHKIDGLSSMCKACLNIGSIISRFNLSQEEYEGMVKNGCEACGSFNKLCIDHDHSCCNYSGSCGNCIRGVLCSDCNSAEGFIKNLSQAKGLLEYMKSKGIV